MNLRIKAALIAFISALPFVFFAGGMWILEAHKSYMGFGYLVGQRVYLLGAPLTLFMELYVNKYGFIQASDHWWAIPVMSFLFVIQWVIWAQIIVTIIQIYRKKRFR